MEIYSEITDCLSRGKPLVLATLIRAVGSVPRDAGAKMLVFPDGSIAGTIGGGQFERLVIRDCLALFDGAARSVKKNYLLQESGRDATGMLCGGEAEVFMELMSPPTTLYIFGGGHIGRALVKISEDLGFRIVVIDDRPDILAQYRESIKTILTDPGYERDFPAIHPGSYVVIVTRGHKCDKEVLAKTINAGCAYIGMIGSRRKISRTFADLKENGVDPALLATVHSPIGLAIGAEGPHEIAVAIAAELIAEKNKRIGNIRPVE